MAMTNAQRQKKFRDRLKAKAKANAHTSVGPDNQPLIQALAAHHAAWGLPQPGDAPTAVRRELFNLVQAALRSDLLLGYPYGQPDIDEALRNVIDYLLALVEMKLEDLPNPPPADILALYPGEFERKKLSAATGRDWIKYANGATPAPLTLGDRVGLYRHMAHTEPVT